METIAVYWEARIKVYGITSKSHLAMGILRFSVNRLAYWSERIVELEGALKRFELVTCQGVDTDQLELHLVIDATGQETVLNLMNDWLTQDTAQFSLNSPVDMIFLHGPHFQDRFGIAETAFSALSKKEMEILLSGCAGTSMYLVLAEGQGAAATEILCETFLIPTTA